MLMLYPTISTKIPMLDNNTTPTRKGTYEIQISITLLYVRRRRTNIIVRHEEDYHTVMSVRQKTTD